MFRKVLNLSGKATFGSFLSVKTDQVYQGTY